MHASSVPYGPLTTEPQSQGKIPGFISPPWSCASPVVNYSCANRCLRAISNVVFDICPWRSPTPVLPFSRDGNVALENSPGSAS